MNPPYVGLRVKVYQILQDAVEAGVFGRNPAQKATENPEQEIVLEQIVENVLAEILERFDIEDGRG